MRWHVHGKFEHAGVDVAFTISLDAVTRHSAELYVLDLFQGPYAVPTIVEITEVDCEEASRADTDAIKTSEALGANYLRKGRNQTRNTLAVHRRREEKPFRMKYLRDAW